MKNHIHPCSDCYPQECQEFCIKYKKYYSAVIRSYAKYGKKSILWKHYKTYVPRDQILKLKRMLDRYFNVGIKNVKSGKTIVFNRKGNMVKYNPKHEVKNDIKSIFKEFFGDVTGN